MRFTCENELHRPRCIAEQPLQPLLVAEQKCRTFVSRETTRKTHGQDFWVKNAIRLANRFWRYSQTLALASHPLSHKLNQTELEFLMGFPKLRIRDVDHASPELGLGQMFLPCAEMFAIKRRELGRHPRFRMNTVGDTGNRHLMHWHPGPDIFPKRSGDVAVQFAHAIGVPTKTQCEDSHAKRIVWINARLSEGE